MGEQRKFYAKKNVKSADKDDFIFGIRAIEEAIESNKTIDKVLIKRGLEGDLFNALFEKIKENNVAHQFVPIEKLNRVTRKNHQGVVAYVSPVEFQNIEEIIQRCFEEGREPFILVLDRVSDVRNFGAIARTAECVGVDAIVYPISNSAKLNSDAMKTSAGALNHVPVCRAESLLQTLEFLKQSGLKIIGASEKTEGDCFSVDMTGPVALVMGSEENGISNELFKVLDEIARIPLFGKVGSLNVSVAAGVLMYEIVKQRQ